MKLDFDWCTAGGRLSFNREEVFQMSNLRVIFMSFHALILMNFCVLTCLAQIEVKNNVTHLALQHDKESIARFFYEPPVINYLRVPLLLRNADEGDPRLITAPLTEAGRTAYITSSEMSDVLAILAKQQFKWEDTTVVVQPERWDKLTFHGAMAVKLFNAHGTSETTIKSRKICQTLESLDKAIQTPRALWEFQFYRMGFGCKVPGFNSDAYHDRAP
jgi:hypothetical protein